MIHPRRRTISRRRTTIEAPRDDRRSRYTDGMSEAGTRYSVETGRSGLTYEDFCALPDDGLRYEIVDGMLFAEPSPRRAHQKAVGNLFAILHAWVRAHDLGGVYVAPAVGGDDELRPGVFPGLAISLPDLWA